MSEFNVSCANELRLQASCLLCQIYIPSGCTFQSSDGIYIPVSQNSPHDLYSVPALSHLTNLVILQYLFKSMDFAQFGINGTVEAVDIRIPRLISDSGETSTFVLTTVIAKFFNSVTIPEPTAVPIDWRELSHKVFMNTALVLTQIIRCCIFLAITILLSLKFQMLSLRLRSIISVNRRDLSTTTV